MIIYATKSNLQEKKYTFNTSSSYGASGAVTLVISHVQAATRSLTSLSWCFSNTGFTIAFTKGCIHFNNSFDGDCSNSHKDAAACCGKPMQMDYFNHIHKKSHHSTCKDVLVSVNIQMIPEWLRYHYWQYLSDLIKAIASIKKNKTESYFTFSSNLRFLELMTEVTKT